MGTTDKKVTRLRRLRLQRGETLRTLAALCGVTERTLVRWEQAGIGDVRCLFLLADHYGVDARDLVALGAK